jgi:hypothetical protein
MNANAILQDRRSSYIALGVLSVALAAIGVWRSSSANSRILGEIGEIIGMKLPVHYSSLEVERPTEFAVVGSMIVDRTEMEAFATQLGFARKTDFVALATWGRYAKYFQERGNAGGLVGIYGAIPGKYGWEFAYDPDSGRMWFFMGYSLSDPAAPE